MSRQCGQCRRPDCPVSSSDSPLVELDASSVLQDQPLPHWRFHGCGLVAGTVGGDLGGLHVAGGTLGRLTTAGSNIDLIVASLQDATLTTVREWVQSGVIPAWSESAGLSPELRCWRLQIGNLSADTDGRLWHRRASPSGVSQLVVPIRECQEMFCRLHDSLLAGHLGVSRTVYKLQNQVYWPGLHHDVRSYLASCLFAWQASPHAHEGLPWDTLTWDTDGFELPWTF